MVLLSGRPTGPTRRSASAYRTPAAQHEAARKAAEIRASPHGVTRNSADGAADQYAPQASDQADPGEWWRALDAGVDPTDDAESA
jgi:hypothetical protein